MQFLTLCSLAFVLLLTGCQRDISGAYVTSDKGIVLRLEIVETPDDHLTGQLIASSLDENGRVERHAAPIVGATHGENVTLSVNGLLGVGSFTLGGTLQGNKLILSREDGTSTVWDRGEDSAYQSRLANLEAQSQLVVAARKEADTRAQTAAAQAKMTSDMQSIVSRMQRFEDEAAVHLMRFPGAASRYRDLTARVATDVARKRMLSLPSQKIARSQLIVDANQASITTNQMHFQIQDLQSKFETRIRPLAAQALNYEQECQLGKPSNLRSSAQFKACERLMAAGPAFREKFIATDNGLHQLAQIYVEENKSQQTLLQDGERMQ